MHNRSLARIVFLFTISFLSVKTLYAQKVANYATGQYGKSGYEHFSFWNKADKRTKINYTYGKSDNEQPVKYLGKANYEGKASFRIQLTSGTILYVIPSGINLMVKSADKKYNKIFTWAYEGPVNGIGTFCEACAEDEKKAMKLLNNTYLK